MKTHDIARALEILVKVFKENENQELKAFLNPKRSNKSLENNLNINNSAGALAMMVEMAKSTKPQLVALIRDLDLKVVVKATDSRRDLLDRILKHLAENKEAHSRIIEKAKKPQAGTSPELMQALSILLKS